MTIRRKTTVLDGYYFREDVDSLVFDRHAEGVDSRERQADDVPVDLYGLVPVDLFRRGRHHPPYGRWRIVIEFEPRRVPRSSRSRRRS
ncbi:MAG: hypothetical protein HY905_07190 [Deltaproteobacteria bacterium]|nr:hypothetical protein [Deltaproteobacteria bacterium]